eukprot:2189760-Pleurochrysis_carterae.AAC.3
MRCATSPARQFVSYRCGRWYRRCNSQKDRVRGWCNNRKAGRCSACGRCRQRVCDEYRRVGCTGVNARHATHSVTTTLDAFMWRKTNARALLGRMEGTARRNGIRLAACLASIWCNAVLAASTTGHLASQVAATAMPKEARKP